MAIMDRPQNMTFIMFPNLPSPACGIPHFGFIPTGALAGFSRVKFVVDS